MLHCIYTIKNFDGHFKNNEKFTQIFNSNDQNFNESFIFIAIYAKTKSLIEDLVAGFGSHISMYSL